MELSLTKYYHKSQWDIGAYVASISEICNKLNCDANSEPFKIDRRFKNGASGQVEMTYADAKLIEEIDKDNNKLVWAKRVNDVFHYISISESSGIYSIHISTYEDYLDFFFKILEEKLKLEPYDNTHKNKEKSISIEETFENRFKEINERLCKIEVASEKKKLKCFISYRFSNYSKNLVFELTRFLDLIGIEVVSGIGYEPRRVSDKVKDKLDADNDLLIYLLTLKDGESNWIRDELAYSYSKNVSVIPLLENGVTFSDGLFNGWEYIAFDEGQISQTYIGILEAINYIHKKRLGSNE